MAIPLSRAQRFRQKLGGKGLAPPYGFEVYNPGALPLNVLRITGVVADAQTVTIDKDIYEFDTAASPGAVTAGHIRVDVSGGVTAAGAVTALVAAINANTKSKVFAFDGPGDTVVIVGKTEDTGKIACAKVMTNGAFDSTKLDIGASSPTPLYVGQGERAPTAGEVSAGQMYFAFSFPVKTVTTIVRVTSGLAAKVWDGGTTIVQGTKFCVVMIDNAGSTDWATTDTVTVRANG